MAGEANAGNAVQLPKLIAAVGPVAAQVEELAKLQTSENTRSRRPSQRSRHHAAALAQVRNADPYSALLAAMPARVITVSLSGQHMWAYDHGKVIMDDAVTTGRPALPTDIGPMTVLRKSSPGKMHSPGKKGSPYWYLDTVVRKVVWFTNTGEGFHDAVWEPLSLYGPGGQLTSSASHGCIHMPGTTIDFMFDCPVGTPVIVTPGDGSPTANQVAADTIDLPSAQYVAHGS